MEFEVEVNQRKIKVEKSEDTYLIDGKSQDFKIDKVGDEYLIYQSKKISKVRILKKEGADITLLINGKETKVQVKDHISLMLEKLGMDAVLENVVNDVKAPMPGVILDIIASQNQEVAKGDPLLILEAMKMENMIKSPTDGKIKSIEVTKGQSVEKNALLIQFD